MCPRQTFSSCWGQQRWRRGSWRWGKRVGPLSRSSTDVRVKKETEKQSKDMNIWRWRGAYLFLIHQRNSWSMEPPRVKYEVCLQSWPWQQSNRGLRDDTSSASNCCEVENKSKAMLQESCPLAPHLQGFETALLWNQSTNMYSYPH